MTSYSDWQWREMASDQKWDKREPAMPTMSFDAWCAAEKQQRLADIVAQLVEQGWSEDDAWIAATQTEEDGP